LRLKVGDIVFLLKSKENDFRHAALYVGHGLYISVYGAGGDLEFSTLKDMLRDFDAEHVVTATPRKIER
jgi:cell wall-associated NlpC family hydrolase